MLCDTYAPNLAKGVQAIGGRPDTESGDYRRVLERKDVEAVFITTPYHLHVPMLLEALSAGKHVFVEKCLMKEEGEIPKVYQAKGRHPELVLQVGLQRRYSGVYRNAMRMIHTGVLGRVMTIRAQWHRNTSWRRPVPDPSLERSINWRMYREYSGGLMAELGSHMADVANWAFESEPVSVTGVGGNDYWKDGREIYDNVAVIYQYPQGTEVPLQRHRAQPAPGILRNHSWEIGEPLKLPWDATIPEPPSILRNWPGEPLPPKGPPVFRRSWTGWREPQSFRRPKGFPFSRSLLPNPRDSWLAKSSMPAAGWLSWA